MQTANNVRLILNDREQTLHAVPVNDDLVVISGIRANALTGDMAEAQAILNAPQHADKVTTVKSGDALFFVARSITEIFSMAAEAAKSGKPVVHLLHDSGHEKMVFLAEQIKRQENFQRSKAAP